MKAFQFPLEKALDWRRIQLELEEVRYKQQLADLAGLDRQRAEVEASGIRAEIQVREGRPIDARALPPLCRIRAGLPRPPRSCFCRRKAGPGGPGVRPTNSAASRSFGAGIHHPLRRVSV